VITRAVVQFSGGAGSWAAGKRTVERYGAENVTLLFADVSMEDPDLYRFLDEAAADLSAELVKLVDGRTPWDVFDQVRFIGNTRIDPCSRMLKREPLRAWIEEHCDPATTAVVLGIDWTEIHRFERAQPRWEPWILEAPLCDPPYVDKADVIAMLVDAGIAPPALYAQGFPHNNCGGFCIKAGQAQFAQLLRVHPDRYHYHEEREEQFRATTGKDVAILRDRRGGPTKPMTLRTFRERIEGQGTFDQLDWGGCGCALED
jgi:3'-phosphoadenosine 5'-phosphosulfate sulfotransferase (PAPS reductase)/FAD synthetase